MNKTLLLIFLLLLLFINNLSAQVYEGVIKNEQSSIVPYVNISLKNEKINNNGWVTNHEGTFIIKQDVVNITDSLIISCIGYYTKSVPISNFKINKENIIVLREKQYKIQEIIVRDKKLKQEIKKFGTYRHKGDDGAFIGYGFNGWDIALYIKNTEQKEGILKNIKIKLDRGNCSTLPVRIHIYSVQNPDDGPQKELLSESVLASAKKSGSRWIKADLKKYRIAFPKEGLFIGFEFLPTEGLKITNMGPINFKLVSDLNKIILVRRCNLNKSELCNTWSRIYVDNKKYNIKAGEWHNNSYTNSKLPPTTVIMEAEVIFYK